MFTKPLANENGFILVLAIAMLVVLTLIGLSGTRTSVTDLKIAGNEREMTQEFYVSDSAWQIGALWINNQPKTPEFVNRTKVGTDTDDDYENDAYYKIVRNYGDGGDQVTNDIFPDNTQDGSYGVYNFWYRVTLYNDEKMYPAGFGGPGYWDYPMRIDANTQARTQIATRVYKVYKEGYNN